MLTFLVIIPILIAVFLFAFHLKKTVRIIAMLAQAAFVAFAFNLFLTTRYEPRTTFVGNYYGTLGIILRADNLAAIFILLTTVIFLVVGFYSLNERNSRTFWFLLFVLEASLIGLFLSQDFFNVFVLVEVGTVVATVLLMYDRKRRDNFSGMLFLMVNIVAMQFYLLGLGYIYKITGALDMNVAAQVLRETDTQQLILPYALIMTSIAVKCSLLPTLTWLPKVNSMTGARSSIAAIMSGLQIKGGIYLFIRMHSIFDEFVSQTIASELFLIIGIITAISGIILALSQTNIKLILAYSTIAQVGLIIIGLNLGDNYAYFGSLYHIVNHSIFKTSLFLSSGSIIAIYKTRNVNEIRGLIWKNKAIGIATLLALSGIIGMPLFSGSVSKYFMMRNVSGLLQWVMMFINLGTILICVKYGRMLFGKPKTEIAPVKIDLCKRISVLFLGAMCFVMGVLGTTFKAFLFNQSFSINTVSYLQKSGIFFASVVVGLVISRFVLKREKLIGFLYELDLSFKVICVTIGVFFATILIVLGVL